LVEEELVSHEVGLGEIKLDLFADFLRVIGLLAN
jgi:hypothetical protein